MENWINISFRDPIVSRDGRPFGAGQGNRMRSAGWPLPSVVAGSLRSLIGKQAGGDFSEQRQRDLLPLGVVGGLPKCETDGTLYLPAPHDCVFNFENRRVLSSRPVDVQLGDGCDLPHESLRPVMLPQTDSPEEFEPGPVPSWWPSDRFAQWMLGKQVNFDEHFLQSPEVDQRTHASINPRNGAAVDGSLFSTTSLALAALPRYPGAANPGFHESHARMQLAVRVRGEGWCGQTASQLDALHPLGGERRLAHWKATQQLWSCPKEIAVGLADAKRIRMALATPAIFSDGWKPGWLNADLTGTPPGTEVKLQLVGVCIGRWQAVSGWSLAEPRGPKPVRRMVPAGGVYFFEAVSGRPGDLAGRWLEPISDDAKECRDGFGLATWGIW